MLLQRSTHLDRNNVGYSLEKNASTNVDAK